MSKIPALVIAAVLALCTSDDAFAARKKSQPKRGVAPEIARDYDGTPIIMKGFRPAPSVLKEEGDQPKKDKRKADRPRPRGSSTLIPPPVLSPRASSLPAPALLQPAPGVYNPPPIRSYGDRVRDCIHSYPVNAGIGNNPTERQSYIRQCAN